MQPIIAPVTIVLGANFRHHCVCYICNHCRNKKAGLSQRWRRDSKRISSVCQVGLYVATCRHISHVHLPGNTSLWVLMATHEHYLHGAWYVNRLMECVGRLNRTMECCRAEQVREACTRGPHLLPSPAVGRSCGWTYQGKSRCMSMQTDLQHMSAELPFDMHYHFCKPRNISQPHKQNCLQSCGANAASPS